MASNDDTKVQPPKQAAPGKQSVQALGDAAFPSAKNGQVVDGVRRPHADRWKHAAAASLHCWAQCAHHTAKEMQLTAIDYKKALEAACTLDAKGIPTPHEPALYVVPTQKA